MTTEVGFTWVHSYRKSFNNTNKRSPHTTAPSPSNLITTKLGTTEGVRSGNQTTAVNIVIVIVAYALLSYLVVSLVRVIFHHES
jgi:hypothetical protein